MRAIQRHAEKVAGFPTMSGNKLHLMDHFETVFDTLIEDVNRAREHLPPGVLHLDFWRKKPTKWRKP